MRRAWLVRVCGFGLAGLAAGVAPPAAAQSVPEGQSCGGLLCDMGVFGHKTAPAASPSLPPAPAAVGGPAKVEPSKAEPPKAEPPKAAEARPTHRRKAAESGRGETKHVAARPVETRPVEAKPVEARPAAGTPVAATPATPRGAAAPAAPEVFVPMTPYASQQPARVLLTPITPGY